LSSSTSKLFFLLSSNLLLHGDENADIGIGFDVDRIGVIDEKGEIVWGDHLLILFSRHILKRYPGATVVGEVKCSQNLFNDIRKNGGIPVMTAPGLLNNLFFHFIWNLVESCSKRF
jgi:phosphomannomutase